MSKTNFLTKSIIRILTRSFWVYHLNTGSCNGCDIEILSTFTPRYDIERLGIVLKGSPRHADVLLVTGPVNRLMKQRVLRIYSQMPWPKFIIAIGSCTCTGSPYQECYNQCGGLDQILPVDIYVPGCPPRPETIVHGVQNLISYVRNSPRIITDKDNLFHQGFSP